VETAVSLSLATCLAALLRLRVVATAGVGQDSRGVVFWFVGSSSRGAGGGICSAPVGTWPSGGRLGTS